MTNSAPQTYDFGLGVGSLSSGPAIEDAAYEQAKATIRALEQPATHRQIAYLRDLGYAGDAPQSKHEASELIEEWKHRTGQSCHYCGMTATSFGFFDEPVCPECGG